MSHFQIIFVTEQIMFSISVVGCEKTYPTVTTTVAKCGVPRGDAATAEDASVF